jgi:hypothetical protein
MPEAEDVSPEWPAEHKGTELRDRAAALLMAILAAHGWCKVDIFCSSTMHQAQSVKLSLAGQDSKNSGL